MTYKFAISCNRAIEIASQIAMELGHHYIGTEFIWFNKRRKWGGK